MKLSQTVKPISYLKQNTAAAIREVRENSGAMVITQNGEAKAVLIDIVEFEQTQDSFALLKIIAQSKKAYDEGKHKPVIQAFADARRKLRDKGY